MTTDDDDFRPLPVSAPQRAIPVGPAAGKPAGVQLSAETARVLHEERHQTEERLMRHLEQPDPTRSARAKRSWQTRRKHQHDRHAIGEHPFDAALEELYRQRDALNAGIEVLEKLKGVRP